MDAKTLTSELARRLERDVDEINKLCVELGLIIGEKVSEGDSVAIPMFGLFEPKKKGERISVHPSTGKRILIPPKLIMQFKPSASLKQKVR